MSEHKRPAKSDSCRDGGEERLAQTVLNSLSANIAILDAHGRIVETNQAWRAYARQNQMAGPDDSIGSNYLEICDQTEGEETDVARQVAAGIRAVLRGEIREFVLDYPCHSLTEEHWYYIRALRMGGDGPVRVVVSHEEITALKQAERALRKREQERDRLRQAMQLAMEVQQTLLPRVTPSVPGLDLAGRSIYCDETGGDYFDYLLFGPAPSKILGIFIGDVSGHGVSSALLMAAARSSLRQRAITPGPLADIIGDVNRQITRDLMASGQFITLLGIQVTPQTGQLVWVRAGHEPALLYRAREDRFEDLMGEGAAPLGLDPDAVFPANNLAGLVPGDILVLYTDGITEARNPQGAMFGRERIRTQIRKQAHQSARRIRDALLGDVRDFIATEGVEDDVTLVVAKLV